MNQHLHGILASQVTVLLAMAQMLTSDLEFSNDLNIPVSPKIILNFCRAFLSRCLTIICLI